MTQGIAKKEITAVKFVLQNLYLIHSLKWDDVVEQAFAMEKEQMRKCASFWRGKENEIEKPIFDEYYNDTYGK